MDDAVDHEIDDRLTVTSHGFGVAGKSTRVDAQVLQESCVPKRCRLSIDDSHHSLAGQRAELLCGGQDELALRRGGQDRGRQRVLAAALESGRDPQDLVLLMDGCGDDARQSGLTFGKRAGLVEGQCVGAPERFDGLGIPEQDSDRSAFPCGDHDRDWGRKPECARAGNDEDRDRVYDRVGHPWLGPGQCPDEEGPDRNKNNRGNEPRRNPVRLALNRRATALSLGDHLHDARKKCLAPNLFCLNDHRSGAVDRPSHDPVTRFLLDRNSFTGDE